MDNTKPSTGLMIPGERERNTLTYRQPGSMSGPASGSEAGAPNVLMDDATILERQREGGGAPNTRKVA